MHGLMSVGSWGSRAGQAQDITTPALSPSPKPSVTQCPLTEPEDPPGLTTQHHGVQALSAPLLVAVWLQASFPTSLSLCLQCLE